MSDPLYVPTDSKGVEHSVELGQVHWNLPVDDPPIITKPGHPLMLRRPIALLEVLDERIYRAEPLEGIPAEPEGTVTVTAARLVAQTPWNVELSTRFALDCASHVLNNTVDLQLPDGTSLSKVIAECRRIIDGIANGTMDHLGYLARLRALRRLRREQSKVEDLSLEILVADEARDIDAFDDPSYASVLPVADSVLAAIEALRHHVLPDFYVEIEDAMEEREEHSLVDRERTISVPTVITTPFGPIELGGPRVLRYEPAWTSACDAARHSRVAANDRAGASGEAEERSWQAATLGTYLEQS